MGREGKRKKWIKEGEKGRRSEKRREGNEGAKRERDRKGRLTCYGRSIRKSIIFCSSSSCDFLFFVSFFLSSSPILSGGRLDYVYHTSTHDVALVRI